MVASSLARASSGSPSPPRCACRARGGRQACAWQAHSAGLSTAAPALWQHGLSPGASHPRKQQPGQRYEQPNSPSAAAPPPSPAHLPQRAIKGLQRLEEAAHQRPPRLIARPLEGIFAKGPHIVTQPGGGRGWAEGGARAGRVCRGGAGLWALHKAAANLQDAGASSDLTEDQCCCSRAQAPPGEHSRAQQLARGRGVLHCARGSGEGRCGVVSATRQAFHASLECPAQARRGRCSARCCRRAWHTWPAVSLPAVPLTHDAADADQLVLCCQQGRHVAAQRQMKGHLKALRQPACDRSSQAARAGAIWAAWRRGQMASRPARQAEELTSPGAPASFSSRTC